MLLIIFVLKNTLDMIKIFPAKETGVKIIDAHHPKFFELINQLGEIVSKKSCNEELPTFILKLSFFAENYFCDEETALSQNQFGNLKKHKEEHKMFTDAIIEFQKKYAAQEKYICKPFYEFLVNWYNIHITNYDQEAAAFLKDKGY
jgi:hemerythrin-like metal-binding protein